MKRRFVVPIAILMGASLSACTPAGDTAPKSQTPVAITVASEYNPGNLGGAVTWTITGGAGNIPDDASVMVSVSRTGAEVVMPSTESSDVTDSFLKRVGEAPEASSVIVTPGTNSGEIAFVLSAPGEDVPNEIPRVHIALIDNASGDAVAVRSVPVAIVDLK